MTQHADTRTDARDPAEAEDAAIPAPVDEPWFTAEWTPRSLSPARVSWLTRRGRSLVLGGVIAAHLLGGLLLLRMQEDPLLEGPRALEVEFVFEWPAPPPPVEDAAPEAPPTRALPGRARPSTPSRARPPRPDQPLQALPPPPPATGMRERLYDETGRVRFDAEAFAELDRRVGEARRFAYEIPRLGDAERLFYRPAAITYEGTRFDQYWRPEQDLLTELLSKAVEKTTKEVRIPVPGRPEAKIVCSISLLALGGSCGVQVAGSDYAGPVDDPATLSEREQKECAAWWAQITGPSSQQAWRATRKLYDQECRKPLERKPSG